MIMKKKLGRSDLFGFLSVVFSIYVASFLSEYLVMNIPVLSGFLDFIADIIPAIHALEANSDFPMVTRRYFSFMWMMLPFWFFVFYKVKGIVEIDDEAVANKFWFSILSHLILIIMIFMLVFYIWGMDEMTGIPRSETDDLVFMSKYFYMVNTNKFVMGLLGGGVFSGLAYFCVSIVVLIKKKGV